MRKSLLALLLAMIMVCSFAACGEDEADVRGDVDTDNDTSSVSSEDGASDDLGFSFGSNAGGVYENDYLGIGLELDDTWTFLTDEEIAELNGTTMDMLDDDLAEVLENSEVIHDMQAQNESMSTISVYLENLGLLYGATMDAEEYIETSLPTLEDALEGIGVEGLTTEVVTVDFAGETRDAINISYSMSGLNVNQTMVCFKVGDYITIISAGTYDGSSTADLLAEFYAV